MWRRVLTWANLWGPWVSQAEALADAKTQLAALEAEVSLHDLLPKDPR